MAAWVHNMPWNLMTNVCVAKRSRSSASIAGDVPLPREWFSISLDPLVALNVATPFANLASLEELDGNSGDI